MKLKSAISLTFVAGLHYSACYGETPELNLYLAQSHM